MDLTLRKPIRIDLPDGEKGNDLLSLPAIRAILKASAINSAKQLAAKALIPKIPGFDMDPENPLLKKPVFNSTPSNY